MLKKVLQAGLPVKLVVADKGYHAESNNECVHEVLDAQAFIPLRNQGVGV